MKDGQIKPATYLWTKISLVVAIMMGAFFAYILLKPTSPNVSSFESCKSADGFILETFPEQCRYKGRTFIAIENQRDSDNQDYVGLAEKSALQKANEAGKAARIVERDNEALPVTMDFSPGRLNLYVRDEKVYRVQVEGE